ncbi:MAG: ribosome-binding factor, partial [Microbacteriaceae bacterium]|nr:ribosome-binding factor [Microbacteriaceae bacterium]
RADSAAALKSATGMMRSEVGKNITARLTPSLEFIADAVPENAALIESLLAEARNRDAAVDDLKKTAVYAGDEDPYVKPRVIQDDDDVDLEDDIDLESDDLESDDERESDAK